MNKLITVRQALEDKEWLGGMLGGPSFATMRALLIAAMGEKLTAAELETFTQLTGRAKTPGEPVDELWIICRLFGRLYGLSSCARSRRARHVANPCRIRRAG